MSSGKPPVRKGSLQFLHNVQKYSAFAFSLFATLHLSAVVFSPVISVALANDVLKAGRTIHQSTIGEPSLIYGSIILHLVSGWILHVYRVYKIHAITGKWAFGGNKITVSGMVLTPVLLGHFLATRAGALKAFGDSNHISLGYITWAIHDDIYSIVGSMVLLVGLFTYHAVSGYNRFLRLGIRSKILNSLTLFMVSTAVVSLYKIYYAPSPSYVEIQYYKLAHELIDRLSGKA